MLKLYLDESEKGEVFAVGGYLARADQWPRFELQWEQALRSAGVSAFHATDFFGFQRKFKGWEKKKHIHYAKRLTAVAERYTAIGIGIGTHTPTLLRDIGPRLAAVSETPHGRFTRGMFCVRVCLEWISRNCAVTEVDDLIEVVLEEGPGVGEVIDYLNLLKRRRVSWVQRYESFATGPKSLKPLQAADLIVYESRSRIEEHLHPTGRKRRKSLRRLTRHAKVEVQVWPRERLLKAVGALETIVAEELPKRRPKRETLWGRLLKIWRRRLK